MRKVKIRSVEEMMALPEGEWVEVPDGPDLEVSYQGSVRVGRDRLTVELPEGAGADLRPWTRGPLRARTLNGKLILERGAEEGATKPRRRVRS